MLCFKYCNVSVCQTISQKPNSDSITGSVFLISTQCISVFGCEELLVENRIIFPEIEAKPLFR